MASDWEDTKYAYVALGKIPLEENTWGRSIGHVVKQKGFVTVPILTQKEIKQIKIFKRNKKAYVYAKNLSWGGIIKESSCLLQE